MRDGTSFHKLCIHPGCTEPGVDAFMSDPEDLRCPRHHQVELKRRIAAVEAAKNVFLALVGSGR